MIASTIQIRKTINRWQSAILAHICLLLCALAASNKAAAQLAYDNIVQINGVTMTADSLRAVPGAVVLVKNKNRGVESSGQGVFSIVVYKGDTLQFSALGFRQKEFVVPTTIQGNFYSLIQLMTQDTFYLPETIIKPLPTRDEFDYAFRNWKIPDDQYEIARKNTDALVLRALAYTLQMDGGEFQSSYQRQAANAAVYYGQVQPSNIMNPLAWGEFFDAWKRGDFRKKKY
jgi:ribosomal protein S4